MIRDQGQCFVSLRVTRKKLWFMMVSVDGILHLCRVPANIAFLSMFCLPLASFHAYDFMTPVSEEIK